MVRWGNGVAMTYPTYPQFRFLLVFRPLHFAKGRANVFLLKNVEKNLKKSPNIGRDYPLAFRVRGDTFPVSPLVVQPMDARQSPAVARSEK